MRKKRRKNNEKIVKEVGDGTVTVTTTYSAIFLFDAGGGHQGQKEILAPWLVRWSGNELSVKS